MTIRPSSRAAQTVRDLPSAALMTQISSRDPGLWGPSLALGMTKEPESAALWAPIFYTTARVPPI
jgi:hypothetical protein